MKIVKQLVVLGAFLFVLLTANLAHQILRERRGDVGHSSATKRPATHAPGIELESRQSADESFKQIAHIVQQHCGDCHYEDGPAPFALDDYASVAKRGTQIVEVLQSQYMPPWLPAESDFPFKNSRRMPPEAIQVIADWVKADKSGVATKSNQALLSSAKDFAVESAAGKTNRTGWQLGTPDLIVELPEAFSLAADGPEVFWNFVLPVNTQETKYVRTAEIMPGNPRAVHHIIGQIDRTGTAQRKQASLGQNGFEGMEFEQGEILQGQSMLWTPGKVASEGHPGTAWRLDVNTDILLQLHMFPTGKPEEIRPKVGLYFADAQPTTFPVSLMLEAPEIDIPAGADDYAVSDEILLPVDVQLLSVYPHAHYVGKSVRVIAKLPDGTMRTLLQIDEWDFNWQDEYVFAEPVALPHGTTVQMEFVYDNSDRNPLNPNSPPKRIVVGNQTTDEMGSVLLQVLTRNQQEQAVLDASRWQQKLLTSPLNPVANQNLGNIYEAKGLLDKAKACYQRVLQIQPGNSVAQDNYANVLALLGDMTEAEAHFQKAVKLSPDNPLPYHHWGAALMREQRLDEAIAKIRQAISKWPEFPEANINYGRALLLKGDTESAKKAFAKVLEFAPDYSLAHFNLGTLMMNEQAYEAAAEHFQKAISLDANFVEAYNNLGISLFEQRRLSEAAGAFRQAIKLDPDQQNARQNLRIVEQQLAEEG